MEDGKNEKGVLETICSEVCRQREAEKDPTELEQPAGTRVSLAFLSQRPGAAVPLHQPS